MRRQGLHTLIALLQLVPACVTSRPWHSNDHVVKERRNAPNRCTMEQVAVELEFTKPIQTRTGSVLLACGGTARIRQCEGHCVTSMSPSVNDWQGFTRNCSCCKEVGLNRREVTFTDCHINGEYIEGQSIVNVIAEPSYCECQPCRN